MQSKLAVLLLLTASCFGQVVFGGSSQVGGKVMIQIGTAAPPPPTGIAANFPNSSWNKLLPSNWPPYGLEGVGNCQGSSPTNCATVAGARIWDDGAKWGQMETANGTWGAAFTNLGTFINTFATTYPIDVMYTFGDTPTWLAQGTDSNCATPTSSSCVPPANIDANQTACNADGSAPPATVHNDCGNGPATEVMAAVYHILSTYPSIDFVECWNEPDGAGNFWSNATAFGGIGHAPNAANQPPLVRLVRICNIIYKIAHGLNPNIKVLSPSFHGPTALTWMHYFSNTTVNDPGCNSTCGAAIGGITWAASTVQGSKTFDITNAHLRGSPNADPATFITAYNNSVTEINNDGLPTAFFDDENGPVNNTNVQTPTADYLAYFVAAGLALRAGTWATAVPVLRDWFYQYDATSNSTQVSQLQGNVAGQAWDTVAAWVIGASPTGICTNVGTTYTCAFTKGGNPQSIVWNEATISLSLGSVNAAVGGSTTYNCTSNCSNLAGEFFTISGYSQSADNGSWVVSSSTSSTVTVPNPNGVNTPAPGNGSYTPTRCGVNCPTQTINGFTHWTDLTGTIHNAPSSVFPVGAKPILVTP